MDQYKFHIGAYSPTTIPMARLADYMKLLAELLGEQDGVHFKDLEKGSTVLCAAVEGPAQPKVKERLHRARYADSSDDEIESKVVAKINAALRRDNATGRITTNGQKADVIKFPGRDRKVPQEVGPFSRPTVLDGVLVRIGGTDDTAHGALEDRELRHWKFEMQRPMAIQVAKYLYGRPMRLSGLGRWMRSEDGEWVLKSFRVKDFELLEEKSLSSTVQKLRDLFPNGLPAGAFSAVSDERSETA
jgi:hypothetical protein